VIDGFKKLVTMFDGLGTGVLANALFAVFGGGLGYGFRSLQFHGQLSGQWRGTLLPSGPTKEEFANHAINCHLLLLRSAGHQNVGIMYYERKSIHDGRVSQGMDELSDYNRIGGRSGSPTFRLEFTRKIHHRMTGQLDTSPRKCDYECRFDGLLMSRPNKIYVRTAIINDHQRDPWEGVFHRG
jgi:hypothetical protein